MNIEGANDGFRLFTANVPDDGMTDNARRNRANLLNAYRGLERGEQDDFVALLDEHIRFIQAPSLPYRIDATTMSDALNGFALVIAAWRKMDATVVELTAAGDLVIAYLEVTAVAAPTGNTYSGPCAEMFRFNNGKIVEWRPLYWDTHAVRIAFEMDANPPPVG